MSSTPSKARVLLTTVVIITLCFIVGYGIGLLIGKLL